MCTPLLFSQHGLLSLLGEVGSEFLERGRLGPARGATRPGRGSDSLLGLANHADHLGANLGGIRVEVLEHAGGDALALAEEAEEKVLGADVVMAELPRLFQRELEDALGAGGEGDLHRDKAGAAADDLLNLDARLLEGDAWKSRGGTRVEQSAGLLSLIEFCHLAQRIRLRECDAGETAALGVLTHALEHLGGDAGTLADETEHDLRVEEGWEGRQRWGSSTFVGTEGWKERHHCPKPRSSPGGAPYPTGNGTSATGAGARTHLLGADEVVAEAAGLLLGQHDNLDGLLGEALLERREAGEG